MAITQRGTHAGVIIVRLCHNIMIIKLLDNHNHSIRNKNSTDTIFVAAGTTLNTRLNTESASLAIIGCVIFDISSINMQIRCESACQLGRKDEADER